MNITVSENGKDRTIICKNNENLLCALREAGISISATCGGRGSCGKCKVKLSCFTPPSTEEISLLTEDEINKNIRLACKTAVADGMAVEVISSVGQIATVDYGSDEAKTACLREIADIGTTTVTVAQINESGKIISALSENNSQSVYGADVLSRIDATKTDNAAQHRLIVEQLKRMTKFKSNQLIAVGNTTMLHILLNRDCSGIGRAPFKHDFLDSQDETVDGLHIKTLPCLHSFIGADISAGILACHPQEEYKLLIDLGTNAELALFNNKNIFATSAAAGPAFEGARISCGMAATTGAVCSFSIKNGIKNISTVNTAAPVGICGSGLIDAVAALLNENIIDETGYMNGVEYRIAGSVVITPQDVREFQLAKSAVRTGIELLIEESGVQVDDISEVLLAGGFGTFLNIESAVRTGLLPDFLESKAKAAGNTALLGAAEYACGNTKLPGNVKILELTNIPAFSDRFMMNITFE